MSPIQVMSTNAINSWHLFIDHYHLNARDTSVGWLYTTFTSLLRDNTLL